MDAFLAHKAQMEYVVAEYKPLPKSVIDQAIGEAKEQQAQRLEAAGKIRRARQRTSRTLRRRETRLNEKMERELHRFREEIRVEKERELEACKSTLTLIAQKNCYEICVSALTAILENFPREMDRALTRVVTALLDSLGGDIVSSVEVGAFNLQSSTLKALCQTRNIAIVENRSSPAGELSLASGTVHSSLRQDIRRVVEKHPFFYGEEKSA